MRSVRKSNKDRRLHDATKSQPALVTVTGDFGKRERELVRAEILWETDGTTVLEYRLVGRFQTVSKYFMPAIIA